MILISISGLLLISVIYFIDTGKMIRSLFEETFTKSSIKTLETVKLGIEVGVSFESLETINTVFNFAKNDEALSFIVLTIDGEIFANYPENRSFSLDELGRLVNSQNLLDSLYVVKSGWHSKIGDGELFLGFKTEQISIYQNKMIRELGIISFIALIITAIIIVVFSSNVTKPLLKLRQTTEKIRQGDRSQKADEESGGFEVISMAKAFNEMVGQINSTQKALETELIEASKFVRALLPEPYDKEIKIDWRFLPSSELGGDSFGYQKIDDDNLVFYLLDVSGHGVGASLYSTLILNMIREMNAPDADYRNPGSVLTSLNNFFQMERYGNHFFTIWYGVLNLRTNEIIYSSGGHPPALIIRQNQNGEKPDILTAGTKNMIMGGLPEVNFSSERIQMQKNDRLYLFSDGIFELTKKDGILLTFAEYKNFLLSEVQKEGSGLDSIINLSKTIQGNEKFQDDCSIIEIRFT